jgi:hypothetical protein
MKRIDQRRVELEHRLTAGHHDQPPLGPFPPQRFDMTGEHLGRLEFAAARPIGPDEIRIAEITLRRRAVGLAPAPQIASGEAEEHGAAARLHALALQRQERFLDRVTHGAAFSRA